MKALFYIVILSFLQFNKTTQPTVMLKDFIRDELDSKLSNAEIAAKYFCHAQSPLSDHDREEVHKMRDFWLVQQRKQLRERQFNLEEVTVIHYDSLSATERPSKPFHMMGETTYTYVARYHGEIIQYFWVQEGKIISTVLMGMGREHIFFDLCD